MEWIETAHEWAFKHLGWILVAISLILMAALVGLMLSAVIGGEDVDPVWCSENCSPAKLAHRMPYEVPGCAECWKAVCEGDLTYVPIIMPIYTGD